MEELPGTRTALSDNDFLKPERPTGFLIKYDLQCCTGGFYRRLKDVRKKKKNQMNVLFFHSSPSTYCNNNPKCSWDSRTQLGKTVLCSFGTPAELPPVVLVYFVMCSNILP